MSQQGHRTFSLRDLQELKNQLKAAGKKVVIKGIMTKEDALDSFKHGADAIWISNGLNYKSHSSPSTIDVLKKIGQSVRATYPNAEILMDGDINRGTDVMKCLAFGANAVFVSQPMMWGLHYNGKEGCKEIMCMLNEELKLAMALTHCFKLSDITEKQVIYRV